METQKPLKEFKQKQAMLFKEYGLISEDTTAKLQVSVFRGTINAVHSIATEQIVK